MNPSNWPGGIQVTRWRGPPKLQKKPRLDNEKTITETISNLNNKAPTYVLNNNNKSIIDNQMVKSHNKNLSRGEFIKSLQVNANQKKSNDNSILIDEINDEIHIDLEPAEEQNDLTSQTNNQISSGAVILNTQ